MSEQHLTSESDGRNNTRRSHLSASTNLRSRSSTSSRLVQIREEVAKKYDEGLRLRKPLHDDIKLESTSKITKKMRQATGTTEREFIGPKVSSRKFNWVAELGKKSPIKEPSPKRKEPTLDHHAENTVEMLMLSDILSQVADRQKRVVVDFEKGGFNLGLVSQSADLNQYELLKTAEIRKSQEFLRFPGITQYYEKKAIKRLQQRESSNRLFFLTEEPIKAVHKTDQLPKPQPPQKVNSHKRPNSVGGGQDAHSRNNSIRNKVDTSQIIYEEPDTSFMASSVADTKYGEKSFCSPFETDVDRKYRLPDLSKLHGELWNGNNMANLREAQMKIIDKVGDKISSINLNLMRHQFEDLLDEMKRIKQTQPKPGEKLKTVINHKRVRKPLIHPNFSRSLYSVPLD